jgi:hypothetical protein
VDDVSPLLIYSDGWSDTNTGDSEFINYANKTFHATQVQGASMTLQFFGTAIYVAGAKRFNHVCELVRLLNVFYITLMYQDQFTATLDNSASIGNGFASHPGEFEQILFSQTGLESTYHTLVMTDTPTRNDRPFLDIDYVEFTTGDDSNRFMIVTSYYLFVMLTSFRLVPRR